MSTIANKPYREHLGSGADLQTSYPAYRAGFVSLALERIHRSFANHTPAIFFIGAAIEKKMAGEIWEMLENGTISNAANLTVEHQVSSIARWLCNL